MTPAQFQSALPLSTLSLVIGIWIGVVLSRVQEKRLADKPFVHYGND